MSRCLIVTTLADEFAAEVERLSAGSIPVTACASADEARAAYDGQRILFGSPAMIADVLPDMPAVDWVQSSWAGVTPLIDLPRRDYRLTGVKNVFGPQMAEYALGYLLAHELKIAARQQAQVRREWFREHSGTLAGKRLGVMGTGSIGAAIAHSAVALGMDAVGLSRSGEERAGFSQTYAVSALREFLQSVDHVVATLPATPATDHLLDAAAFDAVREGAVFINVGRSNVVDDDALIQALESGRLAAAVLDVFDEEPLPESSPLWSTRNLHITAHIAAISHPLLIVPVFVDNYRLYEAGQPLNFEVSFERGY